ncbi:hypothetical protein BDC45DRAFT_572308 [Circinella umbellata]|nr:hypothetical protein BDC45DRAFT_572308 [Circinella umbellata]
MSNQTNDTLYIVRKRPPVDWASSPMELTFQNEYNFNKWFTEEPCHATWNKKKSTNSTAASSTSFTNDTPVTYSFSEQDIKESRLPFDVKNWIEKHVEEKKDWRGMKGLLQFSNEEMDEVCRTGMRKCVVIYGAISNLLIDQFENEINVDPNGLKIPAALHVQRRDNLNQIQQRLNNISRKHRLDKQSTQARIGILKEKGMISSLDY